MTALQLFTPRLTEYSRRQVTLNSFAIRLSTFYWWQALSPLPCWWLKKLMDSTAARLLCISNSRLCRVDKGPLLCHLFMFPICAICHRANIQVWIWAWNLGPFQSKLHEQNYEISTFEEIQKHAQCFNTQKNVLNALRINVIKNKTNIFLHWNYFLGYFQIASIH